MKLNHVIFFFLKCDNDIRGCLLLLLVVIKFAGCPVSNDESECCRFNFQEKDFKMDGDEGSDFVVSPLLTLLPLLLNRRKKDDLGWCCCGWWCGCFCFQEENIDGDCFLFVVTVGVGNEDFGLGGNSKAAALFFDADFAVVGMCLFDRCCCCCRGDGLITIRGGGEGRLFDILTDFFEDDTILLYEKLSPMMILLFSCNFQWFISTDMIQNNGL